MILTPHPSPGGPSKPMPFLRGRWFWKNGIRDLTLIRVCARLGRPDAKHRAVILATDPKVAQATRVALLETLADIGDPNCVDSLLTLMGGSESEAVQMATLATLQRFERSEIAVALMRHYPRMSARLRARASEVLLSRT